MGDFEVQCTFILGNKCSTLVSDADNVGGHARVAVGDAWEIFIFQFCWEASTTLKNKVKKEYIFQLQFNSEIFS